MTKPADQLTLPFGTPAANTGPAPSSRTPSTQAPATPFEVPAANPTLPSPPATLPPQARWRVVTLDEQAVGFVLLRSRRRTIGFLITDDGLRVTAPAWVSLTEIDNAVRAKARWILTRLHAWQERRRRVALHRTHWADNGELPYLGRNIRFKLGADRVHYAGDLQVPRDGDILWLTLPATADAARVRDTVQVWLQAQARTIMGSRLDHFLQRTGLRINKWRLSSAQTRWGSCTSQGNIMLNWRLVHFPLTIIDYVIAHELAHLREMNHGPDFWAEVGQILPDYRPARDLLRQHDPASLPTFN